LRALKRDFLSRIYGRYSGAFKVGVVPGTAVQVCIMMLCIHQDRPSLVMVARKTKLPKTLPLSS
jgi:hypothetical protein